MVDSGNEPEFNAPPAHEEADLGPRHAKEDSEPADDVFVPGRRIQHEWVKLDLEHGTAIIRDDVAKKMFSNLPKGADEV